MLDVLLRHGTVYTGTGAPGVIADVGIEDGWVRFVGDAGEAEARQTIEASGLVVAPGFIDGHTHGEGYSLDPAAHFTGKVLQGVTTEVLGNCGLSVFPVVAGHDQDLRDYFNPFAGPFMLDYQWHDLSSLRQRTRSGGLLTNLGSLVGHGSLRIAAMGFEQRAPTHDELHAMTRLLASALEQGATGLSLGLMYPPGLYAEEEELVALAEVAAAYGRPVTVHLRNETSRLVASVTELLSIATRAGCSLVFSHHKAVGQRNWGQVNGTLQLIDEARSRGLAVYCDVYPYTAGNTVLRALLPPWSLEGGIDRMLARLSDSEQRELIRYWVTERDDWENLSLAGGWDRIVISGARHHPDYEGQTIAHLAERTGTEETAFVFDLLLEERGDVFMLLFTADERDLEAVMGRPYCMIASDGIPAANRPHPRLHGTFARFLARYILERNLMSLEEGIRRITSLPAAVYGMARRGTLAAGYAADVVAFDPGTVRDMATYGTPALPPTGIRHVLLAGKPIVLDGELTGAREGAWVLAG